MIDGLVTINDEPAAGITVGTSTDSVVTAENGRFTLSLPREARDRILRVRAPAGVHFLQPSFEAGATDTEPIVFEGYTEAAIYGTVRAHGLPVAGADVRATGMGLHSTVTAADGTYRIEHLPPSDIDQGYTVEASHQVLGYYIGVPTERYTLRGVDLLVDLNGAFATGADVTGSVTVDGAGLANVIVTATGAWTVADTSAASGVYQLPRIPAGSYDIAITGYDAEDVAFAETSQAVTVATDGTYGVDFIGTRILPNAPPVAATTEPVTGATFDEGTDVTFAGTGTDPDDGVLTGAALRWSSTLDGAIGAGTSITVADLAPGTHDITLTATDEQGSSGSASISITVQSTGTGPGTITGIVSINGNPLDDASVSLTGPVSGFRATNATGRYTFAELPPGTYTVTLTSAPPSATFPVLAQTVTVAAGQTVTVNFAGTFGGDP